MKEKVREIEDVMALMSSIGKDPKGGLTRLLYSDSWLKAQNEWKRLFESVGMKARFDSVGNMFGFVEGTEKKDEVVLTGSHVDTVRNGGCLDGQFGIVAGFLAVKRLLRKHGQPKRSLEVVSFAEEEGSRFPYAFWGSKNMMGIANKEDVRNAKDADGIGFIEAMNKAGFDFENLSPEKKENIVAFAEIHIEQGAVLEQLGKGVGIVTAIVGQKRYNVSLKGEANHAGTTPMHMRKDAVEGAARMISALIDEAHKEGDPLVLTFGKIEVKPNVVNVVPGEVNFTIDTRHTEQAVLDRFASKMESILRKIAAETNLDITIERWMNEAPVPMDKKLTERVIELYKKNGIDFHVMHSGAGHDSQIIAPSIPTIMIFVPSKKGISHNPAEETDVVDLVAGVDALEAVLYDLAY